MSRNPSNRTGRGAFPNMNTMVTGSGRAEDSSNQNIPSAYRANRSVWEYPSLSNRQTPDHKSNGLPTGSGALIHDSQADTAASAWGANSQSALWNTDAPQNRSTSGSTSPTRTRDSLHGPFFDTNHVAPLGPTRYNGSVRPKSFLDGDEDKENNGAFPPSFGSYDAERAFTRHEKRPSQDPGFMSMNVGAVGAPPSRDGSIPPSRHSDGSHHSPPAYRESLGYAHGHVPSYSMSSAGPQNLGSGLPASSTVQTNGNRRGFNSTNGATGINGHRPDDSDLAAQLQRTLALEPGAVPSQNGGSQLNPGSQPWLGGLGLGFNPSPAESYTDHFNQFVNRTRSSGDRFPPSPAHMSSASPAPMLYQMNEPRLYNQANPLLMNQNSLNPWPQASGSRGPRMAPGVDRRDVPSPAQYLAPQAAHLYQPNFYNQNFPSQFPQNAYDALPRGPVGHVVSPYAMQGKYYHLLGHANASSRKNQDSSNQLRSQVLEDFRNNVKHAKRAELKDIYGHIVEFSGDQHGSRFIQQKLETANSDEKDQIFSEIQDNVIQLMKDVFGNYVIQKFFEHGNQIQKKFLASQMKGQVVELSMQMYSCRVVQKALEHVLVDQQAELAKELEPEILKVVKEQNGNHVVQKVIEKVPREHIGFIMDAFRGQVSQLASHMYGCRVVQRLLEFGEAKDKAEILAEIHASAQVLVTDQYGNYVIQHVIENGKPEDRVKMVKLVTLQAVTLSRHKFASNVVERCVQCCTPEERWAIWQQLSPPGPEGASTLQATMKDQYGNYVIQKLLNVFQGDEREAFIAEIKPHLEALKKVCTGRQIQAIERLFNATNSTSQNTGATTTATAPTAPALQLDSSAAPTPVLTMEPNSPQSSSTPSTNASAVGDSVEEEKQTQLLPGGVSLRLQVQES